MYSWCHTTGSGYIIFSGCAPIELGFLYPAEERLVHFLHDGEVSESVAPDLATEAVLPQLRPRSPASWLSTAKGQVMANVEQELERKEPESQVNSLHSKHWDDTRKVPIAAFGKYTQFTFRKIPPIPTTILLPHWKHSYLVARQYTV